MVGIEILKILNLILGSSIILLCLLIFAIASVLIHYSLTYYGEHKKIELDVLRKKIYKSLPNK
ncbi:hypothetical protein [Clostridium estertheticum]|uniref:hypothetical protein n=1 Tax=Clostridium estertheticum TaxID=238834 RepID=UPI001CF328D7|nr:hypothetical protein [Clostridium estertheticum]MCB2356903.1 hypothetical protein [Clostridium estertheticum]WAG44023.1 hypothetical protein LL065_25975 [Clostridium estertheticum]